MTKSFMSYVDLKKQAMKDLEAGPDLETGLLDPNSGRNLSQFFEEVAAVKSDMEEITNVLLDLQELNEETKSIHSAKVLRGLRDRINSDMVTVLRKAKLIKTRLEILDRSNSENRTSYKEGTPVDRTRTSVTNGLRIKVRDLMNDFQGLREKIAMEHKEGLRRRYFTATGEEPSEETMEKIISGGGKMEIFEGKKDLVMENREREEGLKETQRSLMELHPVFMDIQGEEIDDIEQNVVNAGAHINGGNKKLDWVKGMKKRKRWALLAMVFLVVRLLIVLHDSFIIQTSL